MSFKSWGFPGDGKQSDLTPPTSRPRGAKIIATTYEVFREAVSSGESWMSVSAKTSRNTPRRRWGDRHFGWWRTTVEERVSETEKVRDMGSAVPYEEIFQMMRTSWDSWVSWVTETNKDTGYDGLLLVTSKADDGGSFENPGAQRWGFFQK